MGGAICVAIRKDRKEHIFDAWTNPLSWLISHPDFRDGGSQYERYIAAAKPGNEWPAMKPIASIRRIEYGIVLIDLDRHEVYSRNVYCDPGTLYFSKRSNPESYRQIQRLIDLDAVEYLIDHSGTSKSSLTKRIEPTQGNASRMSYGLAYLRLSYLKVDHVCEREADMAEVERWIRKRKWKSKIFRRP